MKNAILLSAAIAAGSFTSVQAQDVKADIQQGEKKVAMCVGCHGIPGYQASFPEIHKVPQISGQNAKYISAALNAYKKGERKHPSMRAIAVSLTDQDIADVSAWYEASYKAANPAPEQPAVQPSAEVAALLTKGACISCHGTNFNKPIDGSYPKIAGQYADYLYVALKAYKTEGNANLGRSNAIMGAQVKQYSLAELKAMSKYIASLPGEMATVKETPFVQH